MHIEHTVREITRAFRDFVSVEEFSYKDGYLQGVRTEIKLLSVLLLIFMAISTNNIFFLISLLAFSFITIVLSRVKIRQYISRFYFIPIFSLIVVFPWIFLKGGEVYSFYGIKVSYDGLIYVLTFFIRVSACISIISLLLFTTKMSEMVDSLRKMKIPSTLITVFIIVYRFFFTFLNELYNMLLGKESRTIRKESVKDAKKFIGNFMARVMEKKERVYMAMKAKGFNGNFKSFEKSIELNFDSISFIAFISFMVILWIKL